LEQASQLYEKVVVNDPDQPDAWHLWGVVAYQQGDHAAALERIAKAISFRPNEARYHSNRALVLHSIGRLSDAETSLHQALELDPRNAANLFKLGNVLIATKQIPSAIDAFRDALELDARNPHIANNLAVALRETNRFDEARDTYQLLIDIDRHNAEPYAGLAIVTHRLGHLDEAITAYEKALSLGNQDVTNSLLAPYGHALLDSGNASQSLAIFKQMSSTPHCQVDELCRAALTLYYRGYLDLAIQLLKYRAQQQSDSNTVSAMLAYLMAVQAPTEANCRRIESILVEPDLSRDVSRSLHLGLARLYDQRDYHTEAFDHAKIGNQLADVAYDREAQQQFVTDSMEVFDRTHLQTLPRAEVESDLLIFLVSMPESGSNLIKEVLTSYPGVRSGSNFANLQQVALSLQDTLGSINPYPHCVRDLSATTATQLAQEYLTRVGGPARDAERIVDDSLNNYLYLGLISGLFPNARVIRCIRDPLDCGLFTYFRDFDQDGLTYSASLANIGSELAQYQRLMKHWGITLGLNTLNISYEELLHDFETISQEIVSFCGLKWDKTCLERPNHQNSLSLAQELDRCRREVGRAKLYSGELAPLRSALESDL
tara:strand:+ start:10318 stop:12123 length:1806 start_codon:yes stop_codon:yes gene_type:complete